MACDLTSGLTGSCKNSIGGLKNLYICNFIDNAFTVEDGVATGINALLTEAFKYEIDGDLHGVTEEFVGDRATGTSVNTQTLTAVIKKIDSTKSAELNTLVYGKTIAVTEDRNGIFSVLGIYDGMDFTVSSSTGLAKTDLNGYTLTGVATTGALAPILDSATTTAFLELV